MGTASTRGSSEASYTGIWFQSQSQATISRNKGKLSVPSIAECTPPLNRSSIVCVKSSVERKQSFFDCAASEVIELWLGIIVLTLEPPSLPGELLERGEVVGDRD